MDNQEIERARRYHEQTKHSPRSVRENVHFLDWDNEPRLFKIYEDVAPVPLPFHRGRATMPALEAIATVSAPPGGRAPGPEDLATLLRFSAGVIRGRFRAAACTGALYEIELYPVTEAGVFHFNPLDGALRPLRAGDYRGTLAPDAAALIVSTGTYFRNAWKYQARTYRHFGWDNGTILANLLAVAAALGLPARLLCGFVDEEVNALLGLDTGREVALSIVALGPGTPPPPPPITPLDLRTGPVARREIDYPLMREMHEASSLASVEEVRAWRTPSGRAPRPPGHIEGDSIENVILRRGSARRFARAPIRQAELETMLDRATRGIDADFPPLNDVYVVVHAVEGLDPGAYCYQDGRLDRLRRGEFRREAAHLALDQDLAGDCAAAVFFLADLNGALGRLGNRGYRAVQLEAGILGGKLYLGAYALGLGATGLTFYDDEVTRFFSPHAAGKSAIFLTALGRV